MPESRIQSAIAERRAAHLAETDWLADALAAQDPTIRVVDMRGAVRTVLISEGVQKADYLGARSEYDAAHIPGAVYLDWTQDIVDTDDPVPAQIASADKFQRVMEANGIGNDSLVIAYDAHPASQFATRLWWALRYYGHTRVRVLNGGWKKWLAEGRPVTTEIPRVTSAHFTPRPQSALRVDAAQVVTAIGSPDITIVDARDADQYTGRIRRGSRGGRIPGALHLPREALFQSDGTFKNPAALEEVFATAGVPESGPVIAYCNGGVAATSVLFTLSMLGRAEGTNYDGSWNEWSERPELPVAV